MIWIYIDPVAKPRMTRRDRWSERKCVVKYRKFSNEIRLACLEGKFFPSNRLRLEYYIKMPKSWSKKKRTEMNGKPHQSRPDLDNLIKSLDALVKEDSPIWQIEAKKFWSDVGKIKLENIDE